MDIRTIIPGCKSGFDYIQTLGYERHVVAVDLGSKQDHTAIVVFKDYQYPLPTWGKNGVQLLDERKIEITEAFRLKLGLRWTTTIETVKSVRDQLHSCSLWLDETGLGGPVAEQMREMHIPFTGLVITSGDSWKKINQNLYRASKSFLVGNFSTLLQAGTLRISPNIKDAAEFKNQLESFESVVSNAGHMSFSAKSGTHDDIVSAASIGAFACMQTKPNSIKVSPIVW
jgi:hypothetical protein